MYTQLHLYFAISDHIGKGSNNLLFEKFEPVAADFARWLVIGLNRKYQLWANQWPITIIVIIIDYGYGLSRWLRLTTIFFIQYCAL